MMWGLWDSLKHLNLTIRQWQRPDLLLLLDCRRHGEVTRVLWILHGWGQGSGWHGSTDDDYIWISLYININKWELVCSSSASAVTIGSPLAARIRLWLFLKAGDFQGKHQEHIVRLCVQRSPALWAGELAFCWKKTRVWMKTTSLELRMFF